jgi:tetratricopeptide (TPR) repeat protein
MEAVKNAQMLTVDFPDRWEPWFWAGTAQLALGQLEAASSSLEHANKLNPGVAQIKIQRAIVAQEKGDHLTAIALLNKAGVLSPDSAQIFLNLGYSHDALGMTSEANKDYQRYLVLTEGDNRYEQQRLSILQRMQGKP